MKSLSALLVTFATLPLAAQTIDRSKPPVSPPPRAYKLPPFSETKLPNGLTVVLAEDARLPLVTLRLTFLAGNKRDPKDLPGLAASVASMLLQGTATRTYQQIAEELDGMGGTMNATAGADSLTIDSGVLAESVPKVLGLLADVARNPLFPEHELALHKQNRKQNLMVQLNQPPYLANVAFRKALFGEQPYAHVGPTSESMDRLDRNALTDFRDTFLVPNNAFLIVVGKLPARAALMKDITDRFASWQSKPVPAYSVPALPAAKRQLLLVDRPGSVQADVRMGKIAGTYRDPDVFPEMVGAIIEGVGPNSRLFLDIREKRGYAYDVHTEDARLADAGTFSTVTQVRNEVIADALQAILDHLDRIAKEPVTGEELAEAKAYASGVFLLGAEPQRGLADNLVLMKVMNLPKDYLETYTTRINSVEPDQILSAAKKYMAPEEDVIVVVGDASKIQASLEKIGKFEMVKPAQ